MSPKAPADIILGTHTIGNVSENPGVIHFGNLEDVETVLGAWEKRGHKQLDTASNYPGSEKWLGHAGASSRFTIHTKIRSGAPGDLEPANIASSIAKSLEDLQTSSVETMFLHVPDRQTPFEDTAKAMDDAFRQGKFKKFGLSNYTASEVQQFLDICEKGYVKPSVFEGHYNAIVRGAEQDLFPLLRKHNMAFMAYSPAAGGIFSEAASTTARWSKDSDVGALYTSLYGQPVVHAAIAKVQEITKKHGITGHAAALRWVRYHSILDGNNGDAVIFAVSKMSQFYQSIDSLEAGPLPTDLAEALTAVYASLDGAGPGYHL